MKADDDDDGDGMLSSCLQIRHASVPGASALTSHVEDSVADSSLVAVQRHLATVRPA